MEWISVKDRLPTQNASVLCFGISGVFIGQYKKNFIPLSDSEIEYWLSDKMEHIEQTEEYEPVTHWMPLPKPPEE